MTITTVDQVASAVNFKGDPTTDVSFQAAWKAAEGYVSKRCRWTTVDDQGQPLPAPDELVEAVILLTSRFLQRKNSPNGLVGFGDLGVVALPSQDVDVKALIAPYRIAVV